ncbi:MAG TPA: universal stress protein [Syntrophales bacterium]|nr:universal stress protein [Syntrophales bacterium]
MFAPKRILVPTDFSNYADNALRQAVDIAKQYHAKIFLLHVIGDHIRQCIEDYCLSDAVVKEIEQDSMMASLDNLKKEINRLSDDSSDVEIFSYVKRGVPSEEVLREQEEKDIDLIVMASHGRTGISRILIGSVAEKVMRGAKCPVMLVRN